MGLSCLRDMTKVTNDWFWWGFPSWEVLGYREEPGDHHVSWIELNGHPDEIDEHVMQNRFIEEDDHLTPNRGT